MKKRILFPVIASGFLAGFAFATDYKWDNGSGDWLGRGWSVDGHPAHPVWDSNANAEIVRGTVNLTPASRPTTGIGNLALAPDGASSVLNISGNLHVRDIAFSGRAGSATVNQTAGTLDADGETLLGRNSGSDNTFNLEGGSWNINGKEFFLGNDHSSMTVNVNGGTLNHLAKKSGSIFFLGTSGNAKGTINLKSGSVDVFSSEMALGQNGSATGVLNQTGGEFAFTGYHALFLGHWHNSTGILNLSGGTCTVSPGWSCGMVLGADKTAKGFLNLGGGLLDYKGKYLLVGNRGTGAIKQTGGTLRLETLVLANRPCATGSCTISGGSLQATGYIQIKNTNSTFEVVGSGADSIRANWLLGEHGVLRIKLDENGSTPLEIGKEGIILTNMLLEVDTLPGFKGKVGDTYDLMQTSGDILTTGLSFSNASKSATLDWDVVEKDGGKALRLVVLPESYRSAPSMQVLSYNIRRGLGTDSETDLDRTVDLIASLHPDLVALSEVDCNARRSATVDQAKELGERLGMEHRFFKTLEKSSGMPGVDGAYGEALLCRYPVKKTIYHELPHTPDTEPRIAIEVQFDVPDVRGNMQTVSFISTHLSHESDKVRTIQARALVKDLEKTDHPVIISGDLNSTPESNPIKTFLDAGFIISDKRLTRTFNALKPSEKIDYVLTRSLPSWGSYRAQVIDERLVSDHRPLLVPVAVGNPPVQWLEKYGLPTSVLEGFVDEDGDDADNYAEWKAGTDPMRVQSFPNN